MPQPAALSDQGAVLTVGIVVHGSRAALVLPVASVTNGIDPTNVCFQAVDAFNADCMSPLLDLLSTDAYISHISAVGMDSGSYPFRMDFAATDHPGTGMADALPAQIGGLVTFYAEAADLLPGARMRHSRMIIPGISEGMVTEGVTDPAYDTDLQTLAALIAVGGFTAPTSPSGLFLRYLAAPPGGIGAPINVPLVRIGQSVTRRYLGTQRGRITPH